MSPDLVRAYLAKACSCMDPNGQWQKAFGPESYRSHFAGMCGSCAHLFELFTRDDLTEAFQHVRRLKSLGFPASSYITQAPKTTIEDALGEFYRTEAYPPPAAAQNPPAATNPPTSPVPPATESIDGSRDTGGAGIATSSERGSDDLTSPATTRPTTQKPSERTRTACSESRALA